MKRSSKLTLTVVLILALSLPLFAFAASESTTEPTDGIVVEDTTILPDGCYFGEDGYCYVLDENGDAQRVYTRGTWGRYMALRLSDGAYCWDYDYENTAQTRTNSAWGGRGCSRRN